MRRRGNCNFKCKYKEIYYFYAENGFKEYYYFIGQLYVGTSLRMGYKFGLALENIRTHARI